MSATAAEVIQQLKGFPQDLSDFKLPEFASHRDEDELVVSLDSLAQSNPTPEARNSILQVAARLPPHKLLEEVERQWILDTGPDYPVVTQFLARALADGAYDVRTWIRTAAAAKSSERARHVIGIWGLEHFETLLEHANELYLDPGLRVGIMNIIQYIMLRAQYSPETPPASTPMSQFASHEFFRIFLKSVLFDTSNHLFGICLSALVITLPFALLQLNPHVPLVMIVLGRAVCWRDRPFVDAGARAIGAVTQTPPPALSQDWTVATNGDEEAAAPTPTEKRVVQLLLIALYGAWPSNIIAYIRDQPSYLALKKVAPIYELPWDKVWDEGQLQSRFVPLISDFMLHPSIITHTSMQELDDEKRWDRYDPSEFVSMAYLMSGSDEEDAVFEFFKTPKVQLDAPELVAKEAEPNVAGSSSQTDNIRRLKAENELLRLESLYSDRLRKQLVHHIGRLHRNSLRFNSDEAEIHTFVNRLKEQSKTIQTLTRDLTTQRSEATQAQQKHVKWQEQLRDKVSGFREERRNWMTEATQLRSELAEAQAMVKRQRDELGAVKNERFALQAELMEVSPKIRHIEDYELRMKQLTDSQLLWDSDVEKLREAEAAAKASLARCYELEGMLRARERVCREQADKISRLESRVAVAASMPATPAEPAVPPKEMSRDDVPDPSFYVHVTENTRKRCEKLERENLELTVEVERLRRLTIQDAATEEDRSAAASLL